MDQARLLSWIKPASAGLIALSLGLGACTPAGSLTPTADGIGTAEGTSIVEPTERMDEMTEVVTEPVGTATMASEATAASTPIPTAGTTAEATTPVAEGTQEGAEDSDAVLIRASDLIGMEIAGSSGATFSTVDDVFISPEGQIEYVVFNADEILDQADPVVAVPWTDFDPMRGGEGSLTWGGTEADLRALTPITGTIYDAPGFVFGTEAEASTAVPAEYQGLLRLGRFGDFDVRNQADEDLGEVEDMVIDLQQGQVTHGVVNFGGFLGLGESSVAVPWTQFNLMRTPNNEDRLMLNLSREQLEQAPQIDDLDQVLPPWPGLISPDWDIEFEQFWNSV